MTHLLPFAIRYGPTLLLVLALAAGGFWIRDLQADRTALRDDNARLIKNETALRNEVAQTKTAERLAWQEAMRQAEAARVATLKFEAFKNGDCDATDPACAVDYINRLFRERENPD